MRLPKPGVASMTFPVLLATSTPLGPGASALAPFGPWHLLGLIQLDVTADGGENGFREGHVGVKGIGTECTDVIFVKTCWSGANPGHPLLSLFSLRANSGYLICHGPVCATNVLQQPPVLQEPRRRWDLLRSRPALCPSLQLGEMSSVSFARCWAGDISGPVLAAAFTLPGQERPRGGARGWEKLCAPFRCARGSPIADAHRILPAAPCLQSCP